MPYSSGYTDYIANQPRPDAPGQVTWTQSLLIQNYASDIFLVIDKEIKGGLHRVKYRSQLYLSTYDGIFTPRRVKGMLCYVELEDDDTPCGKYYSLIMIPGTSASQWAEVGSGANVVLNNPKTVPTLADRDALETITLAGTATTAAGNTNVNGVGTNWFGPDAEIAVGDKFRFGLTEYYFVESILNEGSLKTTTPTLAHTNETLYKVIVQPGDFVNVTDARTPAEVTANVDPYSVSYIWDGTQWLTVYPYGSDPNTHSKNFDTELKRSNGTALTADTIYNDLYDAKYHKLYNDLTSIDGAADAANGPDGQGNEAWTSKRIAQELRRRPATKDDGDPTLFLNEAGQWIAPSGSGGGGGSPLVPGDILGGGGADELYFA